MKRAAAIALSALLLLALTSCKSENISVSTARYYAQVNTHNGYRVAGYSITENEDGSFTVAVTVQEEG